MSDDLMYIGESTFIDEKVEDYCKIVNSLLKYLIEKKHNKQNKNTPLLDLIYEFCLKKGLSLDYVGDAIQNDFYLKSLVENDCVFHKIIKVENSQDVGSW